MSFNNQAHFFTVAQIAPKLGVSDRAVRKALQNVTPSGHRVVYSVITKVWPFSALPGEMQARLNAIAEQRGYGKGAGARYLGARDETCEQWRPPIPLSEIPQRFIEKACKLQNALLPYLSRIGTASESEWSELVRHGLADYRREFGHDISSDHWRALLSRTLGRDRNFQQWARVDLFVEDAAFRRTKPKPESIRVDYLHREMDDALTLLDSKTEPTSDDKAYFLNAAFAHFETLLGDHPENKRLIKTSLIDYIRKAVPGLSSGGDAAWRRLFDDYYKCWRDGGKTPAALMDARATNSGRKQKDFAADKLAIGGLAAHMEGNVSGAQREAIKRGMLSEEYTEHFSLNFRKDKSYVPQTIRAGATDVCKKALPWVKGDRYARLSGPHINRDHSDTRPGQVTEADDVTWPLRIKHFDSETGKTTLRHVECLMFIDRRSTFILLHRLLFGKYNQLHIKSDLLRENDLHGVAEEHWFENGVWRARLVQDLSVPTKNAVPWRLTETGLRNLNLQISPFRIRHTKAGNARAKLIERVFNVLQNRLSLEPGFVGRNAHLDNHERTKQRILHAEAGDEEALASFFTLEELSRALDQVILEYNEEPQNGKLLQGVSPWEMWSEGISKNPRRKLSPEERFCLASHRAEVTPREDGISLTIGGNRVTFCGEEIARLSRTEKALAWWHIDYPNMITVTDLKGRNAFAAFLPEAPSRTASPEQFKKAQAYINSHLDATRTVYNQSRPKLVSTITRDTAAGAIARDLCERNGALIEEAEQAAASERRKRAQVEKQARARGIDPNTIRSVESFEAGLALEEEARREIEQMQNSGASL